MKENRPLIEDMIALSGNILGNLLGARHEMKAQARARLDQLAHHLDLVSRAEFDAAFAMLAKARALQDELAERLAAIEAKMNLSSASEIKSRAKRRLPSFKKSNTRRKRR